MYLRDFYFDMIWQKEAIQANQGNQAENLAKQDNM